MERGNSIETTGSITKVQKLTNLEQHVLSNTLVLISENTFPGYIARKEFNRNSPLNSVYLILMYRYFPEKIERISNIMRQKYRNCNFGCGEIEIQNKIFPCIRIKGLTCCELIPEIQAGYKNNDIKLMSFRKIKNEGNIRVFKHFKISEISNGIYRDLYEGEKFYFIVPARINWQLLTYITNNIKKEISDNDFDPAIGIINRFAGPEDVIRIFDRNKTLKRALEIKNKYLKELGKQGFHKTNPGSTVEATFYQ